MKILQINSVCDRGSTGHIARDIADVLLEEGHKCYVAYGHGTANYPYSFKIGGILENHFHNAFFTRLLGLHGFGTIRGTKKLIRQIDEIKPDIIHLHNIHANYLNYPILFKYIVKHDIPVVFTLHDCFNFTGKCSHYTAVGCYKWKTECGNCPLYRNTVAPSTFFDRSKFLFNNKKRYYSKIKNMTIVAVSKWLKEQAEQSMLNGNGHKVTYVYNWIDYQKFHRATTDEVDSFKKKYNLEPNYKYLISVSQGWDRNASRYKDAERLSKILPPEYRLILVGGLARNTTIPEPIIHIPYISGNAELSAAYSMAEAYVHFSVEDTFGKVIAEAMSCGTVPITFDSTACGEVSGPYGIIVKPHDVEAIVESLPKLEELKKQKDKIVKYVRDNYDYHNNLHRYLEVYRELLDTKC